MPESGLFMPYLHLLRPMQWMKNLVLFFPLFLGGELFSSGNWEKGIISFVVFCIASSATYIINDVYDRERDAGHPRKSRRPLASGKISVIAALVIAIFLLLAAAFMSLQLPRQFGLLLAAYLAVSFLYSCCLKDLPICDLFCVAAGFLFRLQAGGEVFGIAISEWLFLSVFLLSVFLSTGKRLAEKLVLGSEAGEHRKTLASYPAGFLEGVMFMTGGAVLVTYTQYVITRHALLYTVPLCCFGLLRYIFRVKSGEGGDPTESLLKDGPLFATGLIWALMVGWGLYGHN